jgi:hypothetical protein
VNLFEIIKDMAKLIHYALPELAGKSYAINEAAKVIVL